MTLFTQGWHADDYFGDEVVAHHMNTRSVYRFIQEPNLMITHTAPYEKGDQFSVSHKHDITYHESGAEFHSITSTIATFDNWLDAYYCAQNVLAQNVLKEVLEK